jgi:hypothetical protein
LTHHEILGLIEPFTRQGRQTDLAASNRLERKLVFKPVERPGATPDAPALCETLQLDSLAADSFRLTRTLACGAGLNGVLEARLEMEGADPGDLLASVDSIAPESQFRFGRGFGIARSYRLSRGKDSAPGSAALTGLILTRWLAELDGLSVTFTAPVRKGDPEGEIEVKPAAGTAMKLPEDLLAVLGWDWGLLDGKKQGWKSALRLRGKEPQRSRGAERELDRMAEHLVRTLADAPARFHERLAGARWRVALRRAIPVLIYITLFGAALATSRLNIATDSPVWMILFNAPPLLFLLVFCMRKLPRIEIPPVPRRSRAPDWRIAASASIPARKPAPAPQPLRRR